MWLTPRKHSHKVLKILGRSEGVRADKALVLQEGSLGGRRQGKDGHMGCVSQRPRKQGLMAMSLTGKACSECCVVGSKGLTSFEVVVVLKLEAKAPWPPVRPPVKARVLLGAGVAASVWRQCPSVQLLSFFGGCWLTPLEWGGTSGHEAWSWWQISWNW